MAIDTQKVKELCAELEIETGNILKTQKLLADMKANQAELQRKIKALTSGRKKKDE